MLPTVVKQFDPLPIEDDEAARTFSWRMFCLRDVGYPEEIALQIAESGCDLHRACDLLSDGCALDTAVAILT